MKTKYFTFIIALLFSVSAIAQSELPKCQTQIPVKTNVKPQTKRQAASKSEETVIINCHCTIWGGFSGCGTNSACKMYCAYKCRHHVSIGNDEINSTTVNFYIEKQGIVSLKIYDMEGRFIKTLANHSFNSGEYAVLWNNKNETGNKLSPGIYSLRINTNEISETEKIILSN